MMSVFLWNAMAMKYEQEYGKTTAYNDKNHWLMADVIPDCCLYVLYGMEKQERMR